MSEIIQSLEIKILRSIWVKILKYIESLFTKKKEKLKVSKISNQEKILMT